MSKKKNGDKSSEIKEKATLDNSKNTTDSKNLKISNSPDSNDHKKEIKTKNPPNLDKIPQNKGNLQYRNEKSTEGNLTKVFASKQNDSKNNAPNTPIADRIKKIKSELKPISLPKKIPISKGGITENKLKEIRKTLSPAPSQKQTSLKSSKLVDERREEMFSVFQNRGQAVNLVKADSLRCENCSDLRKIPTHCFSSMELDNDMFQCKKCNFQTGLPMHCGIPMQIVDTQDSFYQFIVFARERKNKDRYLEASQLYKMSIEVIESLENKNEFLELIALCKLELGQVKSKLGQMREAKFLFSESREIYETIAHMEGMAKSTYYLGVFYLENGELDEARSNFDLAQDLILSIEEPESQTKILISSGILHRLRGNYNKATQEFMKALSLAAKINRKDLHMDIEMNIGITAKYLGDYKKAINHFKRVLDLTSSDNVYMITNVYYQLISVAMINENEDMINDYIDRLRMIYLDHKDDRYVAMRYRIAQAMKQKVSPRMIQKAKALESLNNILDEGLYEDFEQQIFIMINVTELLLQELQAFEEDEALTELIEMMNKITEISKKEKSKSLFFQSSLIRFKLLMIQNKFNKAAELLDELEDFTKSEELSSEHEQIILMRKNLQEEIKRIEHLSKQNQTIREKLKKSQIKEYIQKAKHMIEIE